MAASSSGLSSFRCPYSMSVGVSIYVYVFPSSREEAHDRSMSSLLTYAFSEKESARLREIVDSGDGVYPKAKVSKLLIVLSWASSRLEGNTYTYLDTQTLIEYGQRNEDKPLE